MARLLAAFGDAHLADEAQHRGVHAAAALGGDLLGDAPVGVESVEAGRHARREAQHAEPEPAGGAAARHSHSTRHRDLGVGPGIGQEVDAGVLESEPVGPGGDGLATEQPQDDFERFHHAVALGHRIDAEHHRVGGREPGAGAEHDPAHLRFREGHVVELDDPVRDHQRVVARHRHDTGAELDPPRLRSSRPRSRRVRYYPRARDIA